jgi:hypothetical protein
VLAFSLVNPAVTIDPIEGLPAVVTYQNLGLGFMQQVMSDRALVTLPAKFEAMSQVAGGMLGFLLVSAFSWLAAIRRPRAGVWFVAAWWVVAVALVTVWIPFQWPRYVLPVALPLVLFLAYALTSSTTMIAGELRAKLTPRRSP